MKQKQTEAEQQNVQRQSLDKESTPETGRPSVSHGGQFDAHPHAHLWQVQRAFGNRYTQKLVQNSPPIQARFKNNSQNDMSESDVNQVAPETIQKKENRTGLPDKLKLGIENLSGYSMDDVTVHYNSNKPAQLQAYAYAQGTDIHLAAGQEKHLPHEAWHVVQQKQGRVKPTFQMKVGMHVNGDARLENEANVMGNKAGQLSKIPTIQVRPLDVKDKSIKSRVEPIQRSRFEITDFSEKTNNLDPKMVKTTLEYWHTYSDNVYKLLKSYNKKSSFRERRLNKKILRHTGKNLTSAIDMMWNSQSIVKLMLEVLENKDENYFRENVRVIKQGGFIEAIMIWSLPEEGENREPFIEGLAKNPLNMFPRSVAVWAMKLRSRTHRSGQDALDPLPDFDSKKTGKVTKIAEIALALALAESRRTVGSRPLKLDAGNDAAKAYYLKLGFEQVNNGGPSQELIWSVKKQDELLADKKYALMNKLADPTILAGLYDRLDQNRDSDEALELMFMQEKLYV